MAFKHSIAATVQIGSTNFTGYIESADMNLARELAEIRTLGSGAVQRVAGLRSCTFTCEGPYDPTADAALYNAWDGDTAVTVTAEPHGTGGATYTFGAYIDSYRITARSNDKVAYSVSLQSDGTVTRS